MIFSVLLDEHPMEPGEERVLVALADGPLDIQIKCLTQKPPPPGYKACPECGSFRVGSDEPFRFVASDTAFVRHGGRLHLTITDTRDGDSRDYTLTVASLDNTPDYAVSYGAA